MKNILQSKLFAWVALIVIVAVIVTTFQFRQYWWSFIDLFFAFMMVFSWLAGLYIGGFNPYAGKKLKTFSAYFLVLMILAFIGEYIAYQVIYA